jgi:hypothetical protein
METNKKTAEQRLEWKQIRKQQSKVVDAKKGCWKCGHVLQRWDGKQHRDDKVLLSYTDRTTLLPLSTLWPLVPPHNTKRRQNSSTTDGLTDGRGAESGHSGDGALKAAAAAAAAAKSLQRTQKPQPQRERQIAKDWGLSNQVSIQVPNWIFLFW